MSDPPVPNERHPLDGTYAYFDSELEILVGPRSTYHLNGVAYYGFFSFSGRYSVLLSTGQRYYWPIIGGTINQLSIGGEMSQTGYEISCVMFSPNVVPSDPTHGSIDLSRFTDAWAGYAGVEPSGRVEMLQLRFLNVTFHRTTAPASTPRRRSCATWPAGATSCPGWHRRPRRRRRRRRPRGPTSCRRSARRGPPSPGSPRGKTSARAATPASSRQARRGVARGWTRRAADAGRPAPPRWKISGSRW